MEEDIKILEEMITWDSLLPNRRQTEALENLIKGYRELEEKQQNYNAAYNRGKAFENHKWKSKIKEIVDECIPKGKNIMTGEEEYQPNTNANSFLTQSILELMEDK